MSTWNTFGFNVRRRRNQDTTSSKISQPDKLSPSTDTSSPTPTLTFAATSPQSISTLIHPTKTTVRSLSKHSTTKLKSTKRHSPKDSKQSTLLPFFATPTPLISTTPLTEEGSTVAIVTHTQEKDQTPLISQHQQQLTTAKATSTQSGQSNNEEIELCRVRRTIATLDLLLVLEEAFGGNTYGSINDDDDGDAMLPDERQGQPRRKPHDTAIPLLQVKQNKLIYLPACKRIDDDNSDYEKGNSGTISQHRRRSQEHEQGNKRPCLASSSGGNQQRIYSFVDEFDTQQQGDIEIKAVRYCLSSAQMGSLLLDIANEFMTFDNNSWCRSYLGHPFD